MYDPTDPIQARAGAEHLLALTRQGLAPHPDSPLGRGLKACVELDRLHNDPARAAKLAQLQKAGAVGSDIWAPPPSTTTTEGRDVEAARQIAEDRGDAALTRLAELDRTRAAGSHTGPSRPGGPRNPGEPYWLDRANANRANPTAAETYEASLTKCEDANAHAFASLRALYRVRDRGLPADTAPRPAARTATKAAGGPVWATRKSDGARFNLVPVLESAVDAAVNKAIQIRLGR